jgi:hypothetical protein
MNQESQPHQIRPRTQTDDGTPSVWSATTLLGVAGTDSKPTGEEAYRGCLITY